jgi:hypothetical protein
MKTCEELIQQSGLLHHWLEAIPFVEYNGWQIRACPEDTGWIWEIVEPPEFGSSYFESGEVYPNRSKALLAARRLILRLTVSHSLAPVLDEFSHFGCITPRETHNLLHSLFDDRTLVSS